MSDKLDEIKHLRKCGNELEPYPTIDFPSVDWLISEVERLRKELGALTKRLDDKEYHPLN